MATHSSTLAWKIPWMEEPGRLQSIGLQRVGHDWATSLVHWLHGATEYIYCFSKSCAKYTETNGYKVFEAQVWAKGIKCFYCHTAFWIWQCCNDFWFAVNQANNLTQFICLCWYSKHDSNSTIIIEYFEIYYNKTKHIITYLC